MNQSWKQRERVLVGTANKRSQDGCFSADAELVAYNVATTITTADLCNWLAQRAVFVKDCKLLTTFEDARSLTFKITVDPTDYERLTNDAMLWPYGVGVRKYRNVSKNTRERYSDKRSRKETYSRQNGNQSNQSNKSRNTQGFFNNEGRNYRSYRDLNY